MLTVGSSAPLDITVHDESGQPVSLRSFLGKYVVLYFYPKDDTPGCTTEACSFRDTNTELQKQGAVVIGISKDSPASHQKFKEKYHLNFPLWSDPDRKLIEAFGVWQQKKMMGKTYMGIARSTFLIDPTGNILNVWNTVSPKEHGQQVLEFLSHDT